MRKNILIFIIIMSLCSNHIMASGEGFRLYPVMGEINSNSETNYIKGLRKKFMSYKTYNNKYVYDPRTEATINRYLIFKALELAQSNGAKYKEDIEIIDNAFQSVNNKLKDISIEENLKKLFGNGSNALLGLTTDFIGKEISFEGYITHILTLLLDSDIVKNDLKKALNINEHTYDLYKKTILGGVSLSIVYLEKMNYLDRAMWRHFPVEKLIGKMASSFSTFVALPISIYEAALDTVRIGATATSMYKLAKINHEASVDMWASAFIIDYVHKYKGNISSMKNDIKKYRYANYNGKLGFINPIYQVQKVETFWDIFFWYTVKNLNHIDLNINKWSVRANIVRSGRLALDMIEKYGNGGNFSFTSLYQLELDKNNILYKKIETIDGVGKFNLLYYMPEIKSNRSNERNLNFDFYAYGSTPNIKYLSLNLKDPLFERTRIKYNIDLNIKVINKNDVSVFSQYFEDKTKINKSIKDYIAFQITPKVTITIKDKERKVFEEKSITYQSFYLPYGYRTNLNNSGIWFGKKAFVSLYNYGHLQSWRKEFVFDEAITIDYFLELYYSYIEGKVSTKKDFYWNQCKTNNLCGEGKLLRNRLDFIKRDKVVNFIIKKFNFSIKTKNKERTGYSSLVLTKWTTNWKKLYNYGVLDGDKNKKMNKEEFIRAIELIKILGNLKGGN